MTNTDKWEVKTCGCNGKSWSIYLNGREISPKYRTQQEATQQLPHYKQLRASGKI